MQVYSVLLLLFTLCLGNICTWNFNTSIAPYDDYDPQLLEEITVGHQNAIWDLTVHPIQDLLISAGADGVCKLWKPFNVAEFVLSENGGNTRDV